MYEVDFLPVENETQDGGKSGDAIAVRFTVTSENRNAVMVIDGGFASVGAKLVDHVRQWYDTDAVDLMISTHPDADHLNGLVEVLNELKVRELLVHQPRLHADDVSDFSNLEALDNLLKTAAVRGTTVTEPFRGLTRFDGQLRILGPTPAYYEALLREQLQGPIAAIATAVKSLVKRAGVFLGNLLDYMPDETLTDQGVTTPRNNSSVITLLQVDSRRLLFTGDAGIPALTAAADYYEQSIGSFSTLPLTFIQAPHHGSKRNLGPTILNRILGEPGSTYQYEYSAMISSAKASEKHPSPKVVNALRRRACSVTATEGQTVLHPYDAPPRLGWGPAKEVPTLPEADDEY